MSSRTIVMESMPCEEMQRDYMKLRLDYAALEERHKRTTFLYRFLFVLIAINFSLYWLLLA